MTDLSEPLSSFPSRPLELEELEELESSDRIVAAIYDDEAAEDVGADVFAYNCVLVTETGVSAAVYVDDEERWYRVYGKSRPDADLEAAYDAIRDARGNDALFSRAPRTIAEAVFVAHRDEHEGEYEEGDSFDCPVCGDVHTVEFHEEQLDVELEGVDTSLLYVECPDARNDRLVLQFGTE